MRGSSPRMTRRASLRRDGASALGQFRHLFELRVPVRVRCRHVAVGRLELEVVSAFEIGDVFVGDGLVNDVQGAAQVGMVSVQALWFRADDTPGIEPDFLAFTPMDVLNLVRRLAL